MLQVEAGSAGIGGQKYPAVRIVTEALHQCRALFRRYSAMKTDVADAASLKPANHDVVGARPLAEHHGLGLGLRKEVVEQRRQFVRLDAVVALLVEQIGAVARHAHVLQGAGESSLVLVREKLHFPPALDDLGHDLRVFLVVSHL